MLFASMRARDVVGRAREQSSSKDWGQEHPVLALRVLLLCLCCCECQAVGLPTTWHHKWYACLMLLTHLLPARRLECTVAIPT